MNDAYEINHMWTADMKDVKLKDDQQALEFHSNNRFLVPCHYCALKITEPKKSFSFKYSALPIKIHLIWVFSHCDSQLEEQLIGWLCLYTKQKGCLASLVLAAILYHSQSVLHGAGAHVFLSRDQYDFRCQKEKIPLCWHLNRCWTFFFFFLRQLVCTEAL